MTRTRGEAAVDVDQPRAQRGGKLTGAFRVRKAAGRQQGKDAPHKGGLAAPAAAPGSGVRPSLQADPQPPAQQLQSEQPQQPQQDEPRSTRQTKRPEQREQSRQHKARKQRGAVSEAPQQQPPQPPAAPRPQRRAVPPAPQPAAPQPAAPRRSGRAAAGASAGAAAPAAPASKPAREGGRGSQGKAAERVGTGKAAAEAAAAAKAATAAAKAGRKRRYLEEIELDGEVFRLGDSAYVVCDTSLDIDALQEEELCAQCGGRGGSARAQTLLECDRCLRGFHLGCLQPPLKAVPEGSWLCGDCCAGRAPVAGPGVAGAGTAREVFLGRKGLELVRIECLWEEEGARWFSGRWYVRPEETHTGRQPHHGAREVFLTQMVDDNEAPSLLRPVSVCAPSAYATTAGDDVFLCEYEYDSVWQRFRRCSETEADALDADWREPEAASDGDDEDRDATFRPIYEVYARQGLIKPRDWRVTSKPTAVQLKAQRRRGGRKKQGGAGDRYLQTTLNFFPTLGASAVPAAPREAAAGARGPLARVKAALLTSAMPKRLPCRDEERGRVADFVRGAVRAGNECVGQCLYISGVPGTGKTATVMEVMRDLRREAEAGKLPRFQFVEVNGLRLPSPHHVYSYLYEALKGEAVGPTTAAALLEEHFSVGARRSASSGNGRVTVLLVDEMDLLVTRKQEVLYNLFEWPMRKGSRLAVIGIANTMDLPERLLPRIASRLGGRRLQFQPYTAEQLQCIVKDRLGSELADAVHPQACAMASRKVAAVSGDVRRCLELCRRGAEIAEQQAARAEKEPGSSRAGGAGKENADTGKGKAGEPAALQVTMAHIASALQEMFNSAHVRQLRSASVLAKALLAALHLETRNSGLAQALLSPVYERVVSMTKLHSLPQVTPAAVINAAAALGAQRLILCDPPGKRLAMRLALNVSTDDLLHVLQSDEACEWLKAYNLS